MKWDFGAYKINASNLEKKHVSPQSTASEKLYFSKQKRKSRENEHISILNFNVSINLSVCKKVCQI